jgi:gas vesicle protein
MNKTTSTILGAIAGAAAGTVIGILFAPDKGSNTRDRLTYRLARYRERLEELLEDLVESKNLPDSAAKSESQRVISDAKVKAEKLLEDVDDLIGQIKEQQ